jgi:DeoR/GlpR family transcriptional regulator of sugar metabolism
MALKPPPERLLATRRHEEILQRAGTTGSVGVGELARRFGVSRETIRRDLKYLAGQGRLEIVHGGATRHDAPEPALARRQADNAAGKAAIGRRAAALVSDGMVVLLDCGTTTLAVAHALQDRQGLTVCTTSLAIARVVCRLPRTRVYLLGGEIDPAEEATTGIDVLDAIGRSRFDLAFIGGGGLTPDGEVTDYTRAGAEQRGRMITAAAQAWFVIDHSKFHRLTPVRIPHFAAAAGLITDATLPAPAAAALSRRSQTQLHAEGQGLRLT